MLRPPRLCPLLLTPRDRGPTYEALGPTAAIRRARYRALCESALPMESVARIRQTANAGLVLGSEDFRRRLEAMQG